MRVIVVEIESSEEEALANRRDERTGPPTPSAKVGVQLIWWGSDCTVDDGCGNTTPESMICDECHSDAHTRPLWIEQR